MLINASVLATVKSAPPVASVQRGDESTSRWLQASLFKGMLKMLTGSSSYTQAAAEKLNDLVK